MRNQTREKVENNISLLSGKHYYVQKIKNGKSFNKSFESLEEAREYLEYLSSIDFEKLKEETKDKYFGDKEEENKYDELFFVMFENDDNIDTENVYKNFEENYKYMIDNNLHCLTEREILFIELRYLYNISALDIAKKYNITKERTHQVLKRAIKKLNLPSVKKIFVDGKAILELRKEKEELERELREKIKELKKAIKNPKEYIESSDYREIISPKIFSARTYNCLKRRGLTYIDELEKFDERGLYQIRNLGRKSVREIKNILRERNMALIDNELNDEDVELINDEDILDDDIFDDITD